MNILISQKQGEDSPRPHTHTCLPTHEGGLLGFKIYNDKLTGFPSV